MNNDKQDESADFPKCDFAYTVEHIADKQYMVKRIWSDGHWDERLITTDLTDDQEIIGQAIKDGSWA